MLISCAVADNIGIYLTVAAAVAAIGIVCLIFYVKIDRLKLKRRNAATDELETSRLLLRRFVASDAAEMFRAWAGDEEVTEYVTWQTHKSIDDTRNVLAEWESGYRATVNNWAVVLKESGALIGSIGLNELNAYTAEIGYVLAKEHWGKKLMPEAATKVIEHGFERLGYFKITAKHFVENGKSGRVMQKVGMTRQKGLKNAKDNKGNLRSVVSYAVKKREFHKKRGY